jgi:ubiquinone/menaquinone biosynthesis C-methylase UbiE
MKKPSPFPQEIIDFYTQSYDEAGRLERGLGRLEIVRVRELLRRYLPPPPAVVCDVGGGAGVHAFWLAGLGYTVHLLDIVPRHIAQARQALADPGAPRLASLGVGDARALPYPERSADALLLFGPLYHLTECVDRSLALHEAHRVLRPGGLLLAYAISRYASTLYGLRNALVWDRAYQAMIAQELSCGQHRQPPGWKVLTTAFFHSPDELRAELAEAGMPPQAVVGIQGPGWIVPEFEAELDDPGKRDLLVQIARRVENEPALSPHLLAVARRHVPNKGNRSKPCPLKAKSLKS